jgi:hypothetical protein
MLSKLRNYRVVTLSTISLLVLLTLTLLVPSGIAATSVLVLSTVAVSIALLATHVSRKILFNYPSADMSLLFEEAMKGNIAAAIALVAMSLFMSVVFYVTGILVTTG